jgi:hypothetical protein
MMRNIFILVISLVVFSSFAVNVNGIERKSDQLIKMTDSIQRPILPLNKIASLKSNEVEKILGRKLTLKEKIAFKIAQLKFKKELKPNKEGPSSKGERAFTISLISLCILILPFGILMSIPLAIIGMTMGTKARKENKNDGKAKTAIILSSISLALIVLTAILVAIILSSGGFAIG